MDNFHEMTVTELRDGLDEGQFSAVELTAALLERIERVDSRLNAFITVTGEQAIEQAKAADKLLAAGEANTLKILESHHCPGE